jgi:hypothetical protein
VIGFASAEPVVTRRQRLIRWSLTPHGLSAAVAVVLGSLSLWALWPARDSWDLLYASSLLGPAWGIFGMVWIAAMAARLIILRRLPSLSWLVAPVVGAVSVFGPMLLEQFGLT